MLRTDIVNPHLLSLLARVRHTNTLVIADRGFPFWPQIEVIDISLTVDVPTVLDVLRVLQANFTAGKAWMASEFLDNNEPQVRDEFLSLLPPVTFELHSDFKLRVPRAIGLIRTAGTAQFFNVIMESA